jgi:single-stranded-DNA-specific exonuclease
MWQIKEVDNSGLAEFVKTTGFQNSFARTLFLRNIKTPEAAQKFLNPKLSDLHSSALLPDLEPAIDRIWQAIKKKERILIWGHEDLDGITAVVALYEILRDLQADVLYYIPAKHIEKHGLNSEKVKNFNDHKIKLVITVDCGITNFAEVEDLANSGIDTVILEHHEILDRLPKAKANVDPKRKDSKYPFRFLAAVGVVFKFGLALTERILKTPADEFFSIKPDLISLVALGTIADRVPLIDENRILVKFGLEYLKNISRPAIRAFLESENLNPSKLTVDKFMSTLLPLFAAANGNQGCHYFMSQDVEAAKQWVKELSNLRDIWREETKQALVIAKKNLDLDDGLIIVKSAELPLRAMGNCASKLREQYQLPAIVIGRGKDNWIGECRGVDQVNLVELLKANGKYFIDYGGHKKACGFSIIEENLEPFIKGAKDYARMNFAGKIKPEPILADAILPLSELTGEFTKLGPLGEGNPSPLLIAPDTTIKWTDEGLISPDNPKLNLHNNSEQVRLSNGTFDLLYTFDENLNIYIKQAIPK